MSIARHHAEWLSLVEVSGPFLSMPVLIRAYPQGLEDIEPAVVQQLRAAYDEWQEDLGRRTPSPAMHQAWIAYVLRFVLELPDAAIAEGQAIPDTLKATIPEYGETLRPTHVIHDPADPKPRLLVAAYPADQHLERPALGRRWKASPATRMEELLHATGVRLGLVTNGQQWMLVDAPRDDTAGFTSWYAELWLEERLTLRAFRGLLGARRFFGVDPKDTIEGLLAESAQNQEEVTDQLGYQVRRAVEVLVGALDRADQDHGRKLLAGVAETETYEAALTVMMRLVFLFCAEERDLLLLGDPLFDQHYAVSPLREQLRQAADQHGEEVLERRHDAWCRLLATFRAVHGGVRHERMTIPPYGGRLFDPDRFPFLEGRQHNSTWRTANADPLPINNRTVLHLLEALQLLQVRVPGGGPAEARRLSFRALDIEQIGHVYEGLLDHTAKRAAEVTLGLAGTRDKTRDYEPEVALSQLEALAAKGRPALVEYLTEESHRSAKAIEKALDRPLTPEEEQRLQVACGGGEDGKALLARVRPFGGLVRLDTLGHPVVIQAGSIYVTEGTDRRSTGTQYTPRSLTEPVVQHALEPLVYEGPAEGKPREQWKLRSARELLALAICDFACGSGAFLVQACRYLAARLLEAWEAVEREHPGLVRITPEGEVSQGLPEERLIPKDPDERLTYAMRLVAQRCLYGVDVNPLAVEMAKLSMWLLTLAKEKPFTFLDHSIRCGDSLLGITTLDQLKRFSLAEGPVQKSLSQQVAFDDVVDAAVAARLRIESMDGDTIEHVAAQRGLLAEAEEQMGRLKVAANQLIAAEIGDVGRDDAIRHATAALVSPDLASFIGTPDFRSQHRRPFHWPLEFPEVVVKHGGFSCYVGNPPFMGGTLAATALGSEYMATLQRLSPPWHGKADLVVGFFKRATALVAQSGTVSLISTASMLRGESLDSSLRPLLDGGRSLYAARSPYRWPGAANLQVINIALATAWRGSCTLDGRLVEGITETLEPGIYTGEVPHALQHGNLRGFLGVKLSPANRERGKQEWLARLGHYPALSQVLMPCIGGDELYNLNDWDNAPRSVSPEALNLFLEGNPAEVFTVSEILGPADRLAHSRPAAELATLLSRSVLAFACGETSTVIRFTRVPTAGAILKHKLVVFPATSWALLAILQSTLHISWCWRWGLRRKTDLVYSPKRCAETFPMPGSSTSSEIFADSTLARLGQALWESRHEACVAHGMGLTELYRRFHDPLVTDTAVAHLRSLQVEIDLGVLAAYGWSDIDLGHNFYSADLGTRFTVSDKARHELLSRLVKLNHERHASELAHGPAVKGTTRKRQHGHSDDSDRDSAGPLFRSSN